MSVLKDSLGVGESQLDSLNVQETESTVPEDINEFEDALYSGKLETAEPEQAGEEQSVEAEGGDEETSPSSGEQPEDTAESEKEDQPDRLGEILAKQTELLERALSRETKTETQKQPVDESEAMLAEFDRMLRDPKFAAEIMRSDSLGLDPTKKNDVATFRAMVALEMRAIREAQLERRYQALEAKLDGFLKSQEVRERLSTADNVWAKTTSVYDLDPELNETLRAGMEQLIQEGYSPEEAATAILKPFLRILPKKAAAKPGKTETISPEARRGLAVAAVGSKSGARSTQFRKGTTSTKDIRDFEDEFFSARN